MLDTNSTLLMLNWYYLSNIPVNTITNTELRNSHSEINYSQGLKVPFISEQAVNVIPF